MKLLKKSITVAPFVLAAGILFVLSPHPVLASCPALGDAGTYAQPGSSPLECYSKQFVGLNTVDPVHSPYCGPINFGGCNYHPGVPHGNSCIYSASNGCFAGYNGYGFNPAGGCTYNQPVPIPIACPSPETLHMRVEYRNGVGIPNVSLKVHYGDRAQGGGPGDPGHDTAATTNSSGNASVNLYPGDHFMITATGNYAFSPTTIGNLSNIGSMEMDTVWSCGQDLESGGKTPPCTFIVPVPTPTKKPTITPTPTKRPTLTPTFTPTPAFSTITGVIFKDINGNGKYEPASGDTLNTAGGQKVHVHGTTVSYDADFPITTGGYATGALLSPGTYTVQYFATLPPGYFLSEPVNSGIPPAFSVKVGSGNCSKGISKNATCSGGDLNGLDFGLTNLQSWYQSTCGNIRFDAGISDEIPLNAVCGGTPDSYAIQSNAGICPVSPGVAFSGSTKPDIGQGQPSVKKWSAGGVPPNTEYFPHPSGGLLHTSYDYVTAAVKQANIPTKDLVTSTICSPAGICNLSSQTVTHGVYTAHQNITLTNDYTFPSKGPFIFLIKGNLTIKGNIHVPVGSFAFFSVSGDIIIDPAIGETSASSSLPNLEGFYSADGSFTTGTANDCTGAGTPDKRLNVQGAVIVNAAYKGGVFTNSRDLCSADAQCPSTTATLRPDLILNTPAILRQANTLFKEIAP